MEHLLENDLSVYLQSQLIWQCWSGSKQHWYFARKTTMVFTYFVASINTSQPRCKEFQPGFLIDLCGQPTLLAEELSCLTLIQLHGELWANFFLPVVEVPRWKPFWGFLGGFAPSLFLRRCPEQRSKALQHISIWEQPTISPSVTTAFSNIFFFLLVLLMPFQSLPSGFLQMTQQR